MSRNSKPLSAPGKLSKVLHPCERRILTTLVRAKLKEKHFLVAVSGGQDSMALLRALYVLRDNLKLKITVAHIHHGSSQNFQQSAFRDQSFLTVRGFCDSIGLNFVGAVGSPEKVDINGNANSEASLRNVRYHLLNGLCDRVGANYIVTAHHKDDVLETRVIRLLRGVGPTGLKAISFRRGKLLRPFLGFWRAEIEEYNRSTGVPFIEDPSNEDTTYFRNWVRKKWLKDLQHRHPTLYKNLSQSLLLLATQAQEQNQQPDAIIVDGQLDRMLFMGLTPDRKLSVLVHYVRFMGSFDYRSTQIREIRKRLDTSRNDITFKVGQLDWTVTPARIRASRGVR